MLLNERTGGRLLPDNAAMPPPSQAATEAATEVRTPPASPAPPAFPRRSHLLRLSHRFTCLIARPSQEVAKLLSRFVSLRDTKPSAAPEEPAPRQAAAAESGKEEELPPDKEELLSNIPLSSKI